jgi:hypothetical protein
MRTLHKVIGAFALVLFGTLASGAAMAQHHGGGGHGGGGGGQWHGGGGGQWHGGGGWHGGGHSNVHFGVAFGFPFYGYGYYPYSYGYPYYPYGYPYAYPAYGYAPAAMGPQAYVEQGTTQSAPAPAQAQGDWYYCAASNGYYPYVTECPAGWQRVPAQPPSR